MLPGSLRLSPQLMGSFDRSGACVGGMGRCRDWACVLVATSRIASHM
jgi:hypothetical protein